MDEVKGDKKADKKVSDKASKAKKPFFTRFQIAVLAFLFGIVAFIGFRFVTVKDPNVHYHANFAVYVNGQRDEFKSFTFYEEVQACSVHDPNDVKSKAHMHNNNPGLVHVHAAGVTWGQFFANLGYGLSNKSLATDKGVYVTDQDGNTLSFILNGQPVMTIANQVIKSEDRLLINYGNDSDATLKQRYDAVPTDAHKANTENDPASCSGAHKFTATDRLKAAIGIDQATGH